MRDKTARWSASMDERRAEAFLRFLTKQILGPEIYIKLKDWKFEGDPLKEDDIILLRIDGWKELLFAISDVSYKHFDSDGYNMRNEELSEKTRAADSLRELFWSYLKLTEASTGGKGLSARSQDGKVIIVVMKPNENRNFFGPLSGGIIFPSKPPGGPK